MNVLITLYMQLRYFTPLYIIRLRYNKFRTSAPPSVRTRSWRTSIYVCATTSTATAQLSNITTSLKYMEPTLKKPAPLPRYKSVKVAKTRVASRDRAPTRVRTVPSTYVKPESFRRASTPYKRISKCGFLSKPTTTPAVIYKPTKKLAAPSQGPRVLVLRSAAALPF